MALPKATERIPKTAMYSPEGEYKQAVGPEQVKALREQGYVTGHEYFSKLNAGVSPESLPSDSRVTPEPAEEKPKSKKKK